MKRLRGGDGEKQNVNAGNQTRIKKRAETTREKVKERRNREEPISVRRKTDVAGFAENKGEIGGGRPNEEEGERGVGDANGAAGEFVEFAGFSDFVVGNGGRDGESSVVGGVGFDGFVDFVGRKERETERGDRNDGGEEEEKERDRVEVAFANRAFRSGNENRNERRGETERERGGEKARRGFG